MESVAYKKNNVKGIIDGDMLERNFNFISSAFFQEDLVLKTLKGELLGCNFKHHINKTVCKDINQRFWDAPELETRGDAVKAYQLGAFHYRKPLGEYFADAEESNKVLDRILGNCINPVDYVVNRLRDHFLLKGIKIRPAEFKGKKAGKCTIRSAKPSPVGVILPHDDMAQCKLELQNGFEIQGVADYQILGVNICLSNENRGKLRCWNYKPTDIIREHLDLTDSGYPYPLEVLEDIVSMDIPINVGDIYFFDASNVHGVFSEPEVEGYRTTISFFLGFINENTVAYWT